MTDLQPELDGLGDVRPDATKLETAAHQMLQQLHQDGVIDDSHVLIEQVIVDLARAVGISAQQGKAAGMAMAAKELREYLLLLPKTGDDAFKEFMAELTGGDAK